MTRGIYPKPPIVEAVVELAFSADDLGDSLLEALGNKLAAQYPGDRKVQELIEVSTELSPAALSTATRRTPHVTFLSSGDGVRLLGIGSRTLSIHMLAPYAGWERFKEQIEETIAAVPRETRKIGIAALSVRYIDRISLPAGEAFSDYLTLMPPCPAPMPTEMSAFHVALQTVDPTDGTVALLTLASAPVAGPHTHVLYDLHFRRTGTPLCSLEDRTWDKIVNTLHERQRDVFEASITDKLRELFQ